MIQTGYTYQSCAYSKILGLQAVSKHGFIAALAVALLAQGILISRSSLKDFRSTLKFVALDGNPRCFERHLHKPNAVLVFIFRGSVAG
jgi:hypothetical protein